MLAEHEQGPPSDRANVVRIRHRFDVPLERLFREWSNSAGLAQWAWASLGRSARAEVDFTVGGSFRVETTRPNGETWAFSGTYTEIEPNRRIAHTLVWHAPMGYPAAAERLEMEFNADGSGSSVELVHTGVPDEKSAAEHRLGWRDMLKTLEAYLGSA